MSLAPLKMTVNTLNPRVTRKIQNIGEVCDFEILDRVSLLFCLTKHIGRFELLNLKTLRPVRVFSLFSPATISYNFNKIKVHDSSGTFCCLQANKTFQSRVFIANYRSNYSTSIPYECSNSTKAIALFQDLLITAGSSSKIRFWDIHTGGFIDDISFSWNSVSISAITPYEEKLVLVCAEETTSSLWIVSLQTKKLVKVLPMDAGQQIISAPLRNTIACMTPSQRILKFWGIIKKSSDGHDFEFRKKISLNSHGNFLLVSQSDDEEDDLIIYATLNGIKYQSIATNQVFAELPITWSRKGPAKNPIKALVKRNGWVLVHDGTRTLLIS